MGYPKFILSYQKEEPIGIYRVNAYKEVSKSAFFSFDGFNVIKISKCLFLILQCFPCDGISGYKNKECTKVSRKPDF